MLKSLLTVTAAAFAQNITVTGTVTDASTGEPVSGATILLKGDNTRYTMTDDLGSYSIQVPSNGVITVTFMGYKPMEIPVNGRTRIDVALELDTEMLEDVVVVGYGSARKISSVVGSVASVNQKVIANRPSANVGDALQGQVSGLQVFTSTGEPMSNVSMRLRGVNTINASNYPLFVLDGTPVSVEVFSSLNSNDIENIVVMKDASSTAIYGSRAANGVIYITTKKGKVGEKPVVTVRGQYGFSSLINHKMKMMDSNQWFAFQKIINPAFEPTEDMKLAQELGINTDWLGYLFNSTAPVWSGDMSVSGATEKTDYYFSVGAFSQDGTAPDSYLDRYNIRSNVNVKATNWLKLGMNLGLSYQNYKTNYLLSDDYRNYWNNPINYAKWAFPWQTPYEIEQDASGKYFVNYNKERKRFQDGVWNMYYQGSLSPSSTSYARVNGSTYIEIKPVKGLTLKAQQGIDAYDWRSQSKTHPLPVGEGPYTVGGASESFYRNYDFTFTNTAEYQFKIAQKNTFTVLLGQEAIFGKYEGFGASITGLTDWRNNLISQGTKENVSVPSYSMNETSYNSYFARISYEFDSKYFIDASWRLDGSSLFGLENQYANFYSVGVMWDIKRENFLKSISWINDLRLNVSYGTTGNSGISPYRAIGTIGGYGAYEGNKGWAIGNAGNSALSWETVETLNVGVSAKLWNFLGVDVAFYNKLTRDLLMQIPFSYTTGHSSAWGNAGNMLNRGVDVDLSFDIVQTRDLYFNVKANFNYNHNEITELFGGRDKYTIANTGISYQTGYPYGEFFYVRSAGVDPRDGMQMWYDLDGNKTKNFSNEYAVMTGKQRFAPWSGGLQLNLQWKGLYVGVDFAGVLGKWTVNNDRFFIMNPLFTGEQNASVELLNIWQKPGDVTNIPSIHSSREFDDTLLENASFLKLKNVQISYQFPKTWMQRTGFLNGCRIYVIGRNLLTFTEYTGFDPEADTNLQLGIYPNSRQFMAGVEFTF